MTTRRHYVNNAPQQTLSAQITNASPTLTVGSFAGWPTQYPFSGTLELGTINEEIVLVTNIVGSTASITRGQDGSAGISHLAGATFDFTVISQDFDEANLHTSSNAGVHGVSGSVVGTSDAQTLTNKTLGSPTVTGTLSGANETLSGTLAVTGTSTLGTVNASGAVSLTGAGTALAVTNGASIGGALAVTGNETVGGTLGVTGKATLTSGAVIGSFANEAAVTAPTDRQLVYLTAPTGVGYGPGLFVYDAANTVFRPVQQGSWVAFTPVWTSTGTAPVLNNGTLTGAVMLIGRTVFFRLRFTSGTTTTYGTGAWIFSLPIARAAADVFDAFAGIYQNGLANRHLLVTQDSTTTTFTMMSPANVASAVSGTVPSAAASGLTIEIRGQYEI